MFRLRIANLGLLTLLALLAPLACAASNEDPKPQEPRKPDLVLADLGQPMFVRHCASCHGHSGRGDGPAAEMLRAKPADLTKIAARRGGDFPAGEVARHIDGRFRLPAHGSRDMPVWGYRFGANIPESELGEAIARGKIASLVEYLMTLQDPPL